MPDPRDSGDRNGAPERLAALTWPRRVGRARAWLGQRLRRAARQARDALRRPQPPQDAMERASTDTDHGRPGPP